MNNKAVKKPEEVFVFEIDRALELLVKSCEDTSKVMVTQSIPLVTLRMFKKTIVEKYREGLKSNPNFNVEV